MKINITIFNDYGELLDKQLVLSLDEIRNIDMNLLVNEAEENGERDGLLGNFDSKESMEIAMDNGLTSDDLINN